MSASAPAGEGPGRRLRAPGLTVLGNLAVDRVNGRHPTAGGCPAFAGAALAAAPGGGRVVTRMADRDRATLGPLLEAYPVAVTVLPAATTDRFRIDDLGEERHLVVEALGAPWTPADVDAAEVRTEWVHLAPLVRGQFPLDTLRHLVAAGHRISFDGQGLVRPAVLGPVVTDGRFDPAVLGMLAVLKVSEAEAMAAAGGEHPEEALEARGAEEVVLTRGVGGCTVRREGTTLHLPAARPVAGVPATGAGDVFSVAYAARRAAGAHPREAAAVAAACVVELLEARVAGSAPESGSGPARGR